MRSIEKILSDLEAAIKARQEKRARKLSLRPIKTKAKNEAENNARRRYDRRFMTDEERREMDEDNEG